MDLLHFISEQPTKHDGRLWLEDRIELFDNKLITSIPDKLTCIKSLSLDSCPNLTSLPAQLHISGMLCLDSCLSIVKLPDDLMVGGSMYLHRYMTNVAYKEGCGGLKRTIYAAWVNGEPHIGAGCFLGKLPQFINAVDYKYSRPDRDQYILDAQECVDRLMKIRSPIFVA